MGAVLLNGKEVSEKIIFECQKRAEKLSIPPTLAVLLVGDDPASAVYVRNKERSCERAGIRSVTKKFPSDVTEKEILQEIEKLNVDESITGFIVQLPLPAHISERKVIEAIDPVKDADGFHPFNVGRVFLSKETEILAPATPAGIIRLFEEYQIDPAGKEVVVVGRSNIVGKPIAVMLTNRSATVTVCHSKTKNLTEHTRRADILIVAIGKAQFITADMVREGAVVIDVGMNRLPDGKLVGDVHFEEVAQKASFITPVPGGVGLLTVASLLMNTIRAAEEKEKRTP